jgi:type I restriction-modification system DNA methylase subunit
LSRQQSYIYETATESLGHDKKQLQDRGAFFTPQELAERMALKFEAQEWREGGAPYIKGSDNYFYDPCVGVGNLLAACLNCYPWLQEEDLYGSDIDPDSIRVCREKFPHGHFIVADVLLDDITDKDLWRIRETTLERTPVKKTFLKSFGRI